MKFSIAATLLAAASLVTAYPGSDKKDSSKKEGGKKSWRYRNGGPIDFSSTYYVVATPDQVINTTQVPAPGQPNARGTFNLGIIASLNTICYDIKLYNVTGPYQSPARTSTHIHQAVRGRSGPPRIAFPNPAGNDTFRRSAGCLTGPFTTGVLANGTDTGVGFNVSQIEANPAEFFADSHTALFVPGVVRGQLA